MKRTVGSERAEALESTDSWERVTTPVGQVTGVVIESTTRRDSGGRVRLSDARPEHTPTSQDDVERLPDSPSGAPPSQGYSLDPGLGPGAIG